MTTGYEPLNTLKPVAPDIWVIDGPAIKLMGLGFSTRAAVIRLASGALWVHSPTKLTEALAEEVADLGPVAHLIAPNWIHYAYVSEWQARFPEAQAWAAPGVEQRAAKKGIRLHFDHMLGQDAPAAWGQEIDQLIVRGSNIHREAVFFHRASSTLLVTDLVENFEPAKIGPLVGLATRIGGVQDPNGSTARDLRATFRDKEALREDLGRMIAWDPERIILAHGRWYEADGTAELKRAFAWVL